MKDSYDHEAGSIISNDLVRWKHSLRKLKMLARAHNACVMPGHDHKLCHEGETPLRSEPRLRVGGSYD